MKKSTTWTLFPYHSFVVETKLSPGDIADRLQQEVGARRWSRLPWGPKVFQGTLIPIGFSVTPVVSYINPSVPHIRGRFEPHTDGTIVQISIRAPLITYGCMVIVVGFFGVLGLQVIADLWRGHWQYQGLIGLVGVSGMAMMLITFFWGGFWLEATRARQTLLVMLNPDPWPSKRLSPFTPMNWRETLGAFWKALWQRLV